MNRESENHEVCEQLAFEISKVVDGIKISKDNKNEVCEVNKKIVNCLDEFGNSGKILYYNVENSIEGNFQVFHIVFYTNLDNPFSNNMIVNVEIKEN